MVDGRLTHQSIWQHDREVLHAQPESVKNLGLAQAMGLDL